MPTLYVVLYLLAWTAALVATLLRRSLMTVLFWPIVMLYPYAFLRARLPFLPFGLQDVYAIFCLALLAVDLGRLRRGIDPGLARAVVVLLCITMFADALGEVVLLVRNPRFSWLEALAGVVSDLRFLLPALMVAVHVRTPRQARATFQSFGISMTAAFCLVIADRYTPLVFDLFNHTAYASTWQDHLRRSVGGLSGPWEVGGLGAMVSVATLALMGDRRLGRAPGVILLIAAFLAIVFSQSRAGIIAMGVGIAGMGLFSPWRARWRLVLPVLAVLAVLLTLRFGKSEWESSGVVDLIEHRFESAFSDGRLAGTAEARVDIWDRQVDWLRGGQYTVPELAFGVGGIEGSILAFRASSHSGYLGPFLYFGLPVGLLMQLALVGVLVAAIRLGRRSRNPGAAMIVAAMMASMVSGEFLISSQSAAIFGFLLVLMARWESMQVRTAGVRPPVVGRPSPVPAPAVPPVRARPEPSG